MMKISIKTTNPLLWRVVVFLCLFIVISGLLGPKIISGGILYRDYFAIYGGVGKALIFGIIALALLIRHNSVVVRMRPWRMWLLGWIVLAVGLFVVAWANIGWLIAGMQTSQTILLAHVGLLLSLIAVALGCFGPRNLSILWYSYRREIGISVGLSGAFYLFLLAVYALWRPLAFVVMHSVHGLLTLTGLHATVIPPYTLLFDKFGITVAQYCSGIESIALFTSLYAIVGLLDWNRLRKKRYFAVFPFALLMLFALNIVRVYSLIVAGYYVNPRIAFSLFHTYAGMIFFVAYSGVFWAFAYKYLLENNEKPR